MKIDILKIEQNAISNKITILNRLWYDFENFFKKL